MSSTKDNHFEMINTYIDKLILNVNKAKLPPSLNIIFDSGAVNGILGIGAALYLRRLEKGGYLHVNKVSGCSIGSMIGLWYVCDCPERLYAYNDLLFSYYKEHKNFYIFEKIVRDSVNHLFQTDAEVTARLHKKLYINYYDTKKCKQRVVSKFKSRAHLITCILRSSHVPFLTNKDFKYQGRYIDGIAPYFFSKGQNLFIQLMHFTTPFICLNIKREQNMYSRLLRGVVEINDFFVKGKGNELCSYVHNKSYFILLQLEIRKYVVFIILTLMEYFLLLQKYMPLCVKETFLYTKLSLLCKEKYLYFRDRLV